MLTPTEHDLFFQTSAVFFSLKPKKVSVVLMPKLHQTATIGHVMKTRFSNYKSFLWWMLTKPTKWYFFNVMSLHPFHMQFKNDCVRARHLRRNWEKGRQMDFIPTRHHTRTLTEDDGTLCLHKQPIIMMMNGCGHMAIVSLFLHACLSIWDGSSNHSSLFSLALVNSLSN